MKQRKSASNLLCQSQLFSVHEIIVSTGEAFEELKKKFQEKPILIIPNPMKPFCVKSDTSKWATGAVLRQTDDNGDLKPCGYISHSFTAAERNYNIYDRELLGII